MTVTQIKAGTSRVGDVTLGTSGRSARRSRSGIDWRVEDGQTVIFNVALPQALAVDYSTEHLLDTARTHELVNACLRIRSDGLIQPKLVVERKQRDGTYAAEADHPLLSLLRVPTPVLDTATLWRCLSVSWDAAGVVYLEPVYGAGGILTEIHPLDPTLLRAVPDGRGGLLRYDYTQSYGQIIAYQPDELIVRRTVYWADPPPLYTALRAADADEHMTEYVRAFFANAGVPSGIIKVHGTISREGAAELQEQWADKYTIGGTHQGAPAVLDDDAEYQRVGAQLDELESAQIRANVETRVCMPFGVPPILIGAQAGLDRATYSNYEQALTAFWDGTMLPLLGEWAAWMTRSLLAAYEDPADILLGNVRVAFDKRGIGPYQDDTTALIEERRAGLAAGAVSINEYRAALGLDARPDGDVFLIPSSAKLVDTLEPPEPPPPPAPVVAPVVDAGTPAPAEVAPAAGEAKAHAEGSRSVVERHVAHYIEGEYGKARRLLLSTGDVDEAIAALDRALDDGLQLTAILAPTVRSTVGRSFLAASGKKAALPRAVTFATERILEALGKRAASIAETTRKEIAQAMRAGLDLVTAGRDRAATRAETIVSTETATAETAGTLAGYETRGVKTIRWTASADACPECAALDGTEHPIEGAPGLPLHPNCGCQWTEVEA